MTDHRSGSPTHLRVRVEIDGGFAAVPGLNRPFELDTAGLSASDAATLRARLSDLRFFDLPSEAAPPAPGAADHRTYTITVTIGTESHTVRLADPITDPGLRELVETLLSWHRRPG